jgi:hypothetical protein
MQQRSILMRPEGYTVYPKRMITEINRQITEITNYASSIMVMEIKMATMETAVIGVQFVRE